MGKNTTNDQRCRETSRIKRPMYISEATVVQALMLRVICGLCPRSRAGFDCSSVTSAAAHPGARSSVISASCAARDQRAFVCSRVMKVCSFPIAVENRQNLQVTRIGDGTDSVRHHCGEFSRLTGLNNED